ncbi:Transcription factor [Nymphaea thermarum]|nr:Transcription factor [Nymphaea thermarum]
MNEAGPDFIGYYKQRIQDLFVPNEPSLLLPSGHCQPRAEISPGAVQFSDVERHANQGVETDADYDSDVMFSSELGENLSDFGKGMLKTVLQECVFVLNQEVEEQLMENFVELISTSPESDNNAPASPLPSVDKDNEPAYKKGRAMPLADNISVKTSGHGQSTQQFEEATKSQSVNFSAKLKHMELQLDEFLDVLVSKSRSMTYAEKVQLRWLIEQLPAEALDRVVEILGKRNPSASKCSEKIHIELDSEDHVTLWRLYYYARAVSVASKMSIFHDA